MCKAITIKSTNIKDKRLEETYKHTIKKSEITEPAEGRTKDILKTI